MKAFERGRVLPGDIRSLPGRKLLAFDHPLGITSTNGICERFHRTVLDEFYSVAFRKKIL